jgi:hypothetical protein
VVEVKIVLAPTHYALAFVSFPDFHFHGRRNQSIVGQFSFFTGLCINRIVGRNKLEFENLATATALFPCIEKFEESGIGPNTVANLFVPSNHFRRGFSPFRARRGFEEKAILSQLARRQSSRLVNPLRVWATFLARYIVALVDQSLTVIFNAIGVWGARPQAHQDNASASPQTKIHSTLKTGRFSLTHFDIGDDVTWSNHGRSSRNRARQ